MLLANFFVVAFVKCIFLCRVAYQIDIDKVEIEIVTFCLNYKAMLALNSIFAVAFAFFISKVHDVFFSSEKPINEG